jgi:hypothetical protein
MNAEQEMFGVVDSESSFLLAAASSLHFAVLALPSVFVPVQHVSKSGIAVPHPKDLTA